MNNLLLKSMLSIVCLLSSITASAYDFETDGIYYSITSSKEQTVKVTTKDNSYNSYSGSVVIPESVNYDGNSYSVTSIGNQAFYGCTELTSITIPNSVNQIDLHAFYRCTGLTKFIVDSENENYSDLDGVLCSKDKSTILAYPNAKSPTYSIPNSVTQIGDYAFSDCTSLTNITIGNSVTSVGYYAFLDCTSLTNITIPNSVTSIGDQAFYGCTSLTSITIGNSVSEFGYDVFYGCSGLTKFIVDSGNESYSDLDGVLCNKNKSTILAYPNAKSPTYTIPNSITKIGDYAFLGCTNLTSITIGNSVTEIGHNVFYGCSGLTKFIVDSGNESYSDLDGVLCNKDKSTIIIYPNAKSPTYTIPNSITKIGENAFLDCTNLTSITIGNSVTKIEDWAFYDCTGLTNVIIGNSITEIGKRVFQNCTNLTNITIPNSVTKIGLCAFRGCTGLTSITIPNLVTEIEISAFSGCTGLTSVMIPNSITKIGSSAFSDCTGLTSITIPNSVTKIEEQAFYGCIGLTSITIPNSVTEIEISAFRGCTGLTSVMIPNSITKIGSSAFSDCTGLTSVTIPNSVTEIEISAFEGCTSLTKFIVDSGNESYSDLDGVLCNKDKSTIIIYPNAKSPTYTIPNSVTKIGEQAFFGCTSLTNVTIGNSVSEIGEWGFSLCTSLTSITIPNSVTKMGKYIFYGCTGLTSVTIGNLVTEMGGGTFFNCTSLKEIYNLSTTPQAVKPTEFGNVNKDSCTLYVPKGTLDAYKSANIWKEFINIKEIVTGITSITGDEVKIAVVDNEITIVGVDTEEQVEVYSMNGKLIYSGTKKIITVQESGVYIVKVAGVTKKIVL